MPESADVARKLSTLLDMGFERVDASPISTEAVPIDRHATKVTSTRPAMGTLVSVTAIADSRLRAEEAIGRSFAEMDRLIGIFSRYESASAICVLNAEGRLEGPPTELAHVVAQARHHHRWSAGAFDVTVAPLVDLFRGVGGPAPHPPTAAELREARALVGFEHVTSSERRIGFARPGMGMTLDGIAKGYIVDAMARHLEHRGVRRYLINAGGDIRAAGTKEGRRPWTVAVQDPAKRGAYPDTIHLHDGAVATSGSYEIYFDRDGRFHHIVDAQAGRSPDRSTSVSVIAPSAIAADALATAIFVMAPAEGMAYVETLPGCACLIVDRHGRPWKSSGWVSAAPITGGEATP
ncbi:MAG: FAD:protein FMN transferase [Gemmatimonadota bacterium]|nr:FAD:protein FMN transferase [Gemmatimonadota bacterium]